MAALCGVQDLSSLTRDGTQACYRGSWESGPLDHQGGPDDFLLKTKTSLVAGAQEEGGWEVKLER